MVAQVKEKTEQPGSRTWADGGYSDYEPQRGCIYSQGQLSDIQQRKGNQPRYAYVPAQGSPEGGKSRDEIGWY